METTTTTSTAAAVQPLPLNKDALLKEIDTSTYRERVARAALLGEFSTSFSFLCFSSFTPKGKQNANSSELQALIKELRTVSSVFIYVYFYFS